VQLGVAAGARVLATAGGPAKVAFCRQLGADPAIDYQAEDFVARVLDVTGGTGAEIICDLVGGEVALQSFRCIAREGRYVVAGFSAGQEYGEKGLPPRAVCKGNFDVVGALMSWRSRPDPPRRQAGFNAFSREVGQQIHDDLLRLLSEGRIRPIVGKVVPFEQVPTALEDLECRRTIGKTVVQIA
jgi:NADPH2:quinone reductase